MRPSHRLLIYSLLSSVCALGILSNIAGSQTPDTLNATGSFVDSGQQLGSAVTKGIAAADIDRDGDLDLFAANAGANSVFKNDGTASFTNSGQSLGSQTSNAVALGDLDKDNDLDAVVANTGANQLWLNDGFGSFSPGPQLGAVVSDSQGIALGDLDRDSDLDIFVANIGANQVWLNGEGGDPVGTFRNSGQSLGSSPSRSVVLGDVDEDGDLDAVVANGSAGNYPSKVWLNQGGVQGGTEGSFADSGQALDGSWNYGVALGDLDGDVDLDLILSSWDSSGSVWINQGGTQLGTPGQFSNTMQSLSGSGSLGVKLADVDGDSDLDAFVARYTSLPNELWINQGGLQAGQAGVFTLTQSLGTIAAYAVDAADLDGDNDRDVVFGAFGANQVWFNCDEMLNATFAVDARTNAFGRPTFPWASAEDASLPVRLSCPATQSLTATARIESITSTMTTTLPYFSGEQTKILGVMNPMPSPSETFTLTLGLDLTQLFRSKLSTLRFGTLNLVFVEPGQGQPSCLLCFVDWMLRLLGFDTSFWALHHVDLPVLRNSLSWGYYTQLFRDNSQEMATIIATHPLLLWTSLDVLESATPLILALDNGQGDLAMISSDFVDDTTYLLEGIRDAAGPQLAGSIQLELDVLELDSFTGLNMNEVQTRIEARIATQLYLPVVANSRP